MFELLYIQKEKFASVPLERYGEARWSWSIHYNLEAILQLVE